MQALFGKTWAINESWSSDGRVTKRQMERWRVRIDEFMNDLKPGDTWLRVAPIDRGWRQEPVKVAMPAAAHYRSEESVTMSGEISLDSGVVISARLDAGSGARVRHVAGSKWPPTISPAASPAGLSARARRAHGHRHFREV